MISCIIPVTANDVAHLFYLMVDLLLSASRCREEVEFIIVENGEKGKVEMLVEALYLSSITYHYLPSKDRVGAKNFGAEIARGDTLVFIDADSRCSHNLFQEVSEKAKGERSFGGGCKSFILSTFSFGALSFLLFTLFVLAIKGLFNPLNPFFVGIFWIKKAAFKKIGGWRHVTLKDISSLFSFVPAIYQVADDIDFAVRMKQFEKESGLSFASLTTVKHIWNTRKFDLFGSWSWLPGVKKNEKRVALFLGAYGR